MAAAMHAPHGPSEQENIAQALQTEPVLQMLCMYTELCTHMILETSIYVYTETSLYLCVCDCLFVANQRHSSSQVLGLLHGPSCAIKAMLDALNIDAVECNGQGSLLRRSFA